MTMDTMRDEMEFSQSMIDSLQTAASYPSHQTGQIHTLQTHSAWIILTGEYAYKIKKPVNFGFLDFSTREKRRLCCEKELLLNRRLSPDIYLSVEKVYQHGDRIVIGQEQGQLLDYAVKMRQFPTRMLLSDMAQQRSLNSGHIDQMISLIGNFHLKAERANQSSDLGTAERVQFWMCENFETIAGHLNSAEEKQALDIIQQWVDRENPRLKSYFENRHAKGYVRDCHGDLHLRNLTLIEGRVTAFDCIEFNDELRWIDVISEVAFLLMDLETQHYSELAHRFINGYLQLTADYEGLRGMTYYSVYRAVVRAKVAVLRRNQLDVHSDDYQAETENYAHYMDYALSRIRRKKPGLLITFGLSGSGKSTVARQLCEKLGIIQICSDIERKRLSGISMHADSQSSANQGIYTSGQTEKTYQRLIDLAAEVIDSGYSVLLDATFLKKQYRDQAKQLAEQKNVCFSILHCHSPDAVLEQRIRKRESEAEEISEATVSILHLQQASVEQLSERELQATVDVNTDRDDHLSQLLADKKLQLL